MRLGCAVLLVLALGGCSGDKSEGDGTGTKLSPQSFCAELRKAHCAYSTRCKAFTSQQGCDDRELQWHGPVDCTYLERSVADQRVTFDSAAAKSCLDAISKTQACARFHGFETVESCQKAVAGKVAENGACIHHADCAPTHYCDSSGTVCPGTCKARVVANSTATDGTKCQLGLYFDYNASKCLSRSAENQACQVDQQCVDGLYCTNTKVCAKTKVEGTACTTTNECEGKLECIGAVCASKPTTGGTCSNTIRCMEDLSCVNSTCGALVAAGGTCVGDNDCTRGHFCASGGATKVCTAEKKASESCASGARCAANLYCDASSICQPQKKLGEACTNTPFGQCEIWTTCTNNVCATTRCADTTP